MLHASLNFVRAVYRAPRIKRSDEGRVKRLELIIKLYNSCLIANKALLFKVKNYYAMACDYVINFVTYEGDCQFSCKFCRCIVFLRFYLLSR